MKKINILFVLFTLSACGILPKVDWNKPIETSSRVKIERDEFKKVITFTGPDIAGFFDAVYIRAWKFINTSNFEYQIYVMDQYDGDWRFYNSAYDSSGNRLDTLLISREVGSCSTYSCSHYEHIGINVSKEYLDNHLSNGIKFKVSGNAGEQVFYIPGAYIEGFLSKVK